MRWLLSGAGLLILALDAYVYFRARGKHYDALSSRWLNPDLAPPALGAENPHVYQPAQNLKCCALCGGGRLHRVHAGVN
jgi:hypothetical protein